jgi:hypothetical protein
MVGVDGAPVGGASAASAILPQFSGPVTDRNNTSRRECVLCLDLNLRGEGVQQSKIAFEGEAGKWWFPGFADVEIRSTHQWRSLGSEGRREGERSDGDDEPWPSGV